MTVRGSGMSLMSEKCSKNVCEKLNLVNPLATDPLAGNDSLTDCGLTDSETEKPKAQLERTDRR